MAVPMALGERFVRLWECAEHGVTNREMVQKHGRNLHEWLKSMRKAVARGHLVCHTPGIPGAVYFRGPVEPPPLRTKEQMEQDRREARRERERAKAALERAMRPPPIQRVPKTSPRVFKPAPAVVAHGQKVAAATAARPAGGPALVPDGLRVEVCPAPMEHGSRARWATIPSRPGPFASLRIGQYLD